MNLNLDDQGISLPAFPSMTDLKLHNSYVIPKLVNKVKVNLNLSNVSGPDCIPVVAVKRFVPELTYVLAGLAG